MNATDTLIIGGGQAGLAMSRSLSERGVEHVVLERGQPGERWRSERWDSLRLLTPRWLSRVSDWDDVDAADPHGFMDRTAVIRYLEGYVRAFAVPIRTGLTVRSVVREGAGFRIETDRESWSAENVVVATGECQRAFVPPMARRLPKDVEQIVPTGYRNPDRLPPGGVLVVGASATGIQLAEEIHASGRPVTLSVGRHTRLPRRYRGRDILEWFHRMGLLDERIGHVKDPAASRNQPSMQLIGSSDHRSLDLGMLHRAGVRLVGRAVDVAGREVRFADDLVESLASSDLKLARLRLRIDRHIQREGLASLVDPAEPFVPAPLPDAPTRMDLKARGIGTVLWATGFRRSYPWLHLPVVDPHGEVRHDGGVTALPGLYILGLNFLRRRSSSFLTGVARDADDLADHLIESRDRRPRAGRAA